MRRATVSSLAALALALMLAGCSFYSFSGGGLPLDIRTAAVVPFENLTSDPTLGQEIDLTIREAVQRRLGLRAAAEGQADAIVKGTVRSYNPDQPLAFTGTGTGTGGSRQVQVTRRQVQIVVEVEIINRLTEKAVMAKQSFSVNGEYDQGREAEGRKKALDKLITEIVSKARSQW